MNREAQLKNSKSEGTAGGWPLGGKVYGTDLVDRPDRYAEGKLDAK